MEVAFEPFNKVSFRSYLAYESSDVFANVIAMAQPPGVVGQSRLFWANGILFRFFTHPPSEAISKEFLNGHLIWDHIEFAPMPTYSREMKIPERPMVTIIVINVSNHVVFGSVADYIRENLLRKKS